MYVEIDLAHDAPAPRLMERDDFQRFKLVLRGAEDLPRASVALGSTGQLVDRERARLRIDAVRELAGPEGATDAWRERFDGMLAYAEQQGWIDEGHIEAHCEWEGETA
jgi:hypothetical protein